MKNLFINVPEISEGLGITELDAPTNPLRRQTGKKHTFRQCKNLGLLDSILIAYPYDDDGEALRFESAGIPEGQKGIIKDFLVRELKPGLTKFDPDCWNYKISKTWNYYQRAKAQKLAVGKVVPWLEGEKNAEAVMSLGILGITFQGGHRKGEKLRENIQQVKDDGAALLLWCFDNDATGRDETEIAREICASIGLPFATFDITKIWADCPVKGDIADYIKEFKPTKEFLINAFLEQIEEQRLAPVQQIEIKQSSKAIYSPGSSSTGKAEVTAFTPEEIAERKARIVKGDYKLIDFVTDSAKNTIEKGSLVGRRSSEFPHMVWELCECYNFLTELGVALKENPEDLIKVWIKSSGLTSNDDAYGDVYKHYEKNINRQANTAKQNHILRILGSKPTPKPEATTKAKKIIDVEIAPVEPFKFIPLADRNNPLVKANPNAHWNRGSSSLALAQTESEMPIVFCYGEDNGKLLAKHGYLAGVIPDIKPSQVNLRYWGGFTKPDWEGVTEETKVKYQSEIKPGIRDFISHKKKSGRFSAQGRDLYVVLNGTKPGLMDYIKLLQKLDSTKNNVYVVDYKFPSVIEASYGIESFNAAYAKAVPFVAWFTCKMSSPLQVPDLIIPATEKYFPKEAIAILEKYRFVVYTGIHGSGKSIQIAKQIEKNTKEGILTIAFYKTIILKEQGKAKMGLPTIEDVVEEGKLDDSLALLSCMDSVDKTARFLFILGYLNPESPLFGKFEVMVDEPTETLTHLAIGTGTYLADHRPAASTAFGKLVHHARRTSIFDADVSPIFIDYLYELTQCKPYIIQHARKAHNETVYIWRGKSPDAMLNLGLINSLKKHPDKAFMWQTSSVAFDTEWQPDNTADYVAKHDDRKINVITPAATTDPNNENFELLSKRFDDGTTKLDLQMEKYSQEKQLVMINVASIGTSIESPFEKNFIVAPAIHSPWAVVQNMRRVRRDREIHLWVQEINTGKSHIYDSTDAEEIRKYVHKQDDCVRLDFLAHGDEIDDIPYDRIFEDFKCKLAALLNWFNHHFGQAVKALLKYKWESTLILEEEYIKQTVTEEETDEYSRNGLSLSYEVDRIRNARILAKHQAVVDAYRLNDSEYATLMQKREKLTEAEQNSKTLYEFENEYQGCIACTAEAVGEYLDRKPYKLQNQYYFLNPEKDRFKASLTVEKSVENGRRDRVDQLRKTARIAGITELHKLNFERFFHELYSAKGVTETPFDAFKKIQDGQYKWIESTVTATKEDGEEYTRYNLNLKNLAWTSLIELFESMGNKCSNVFGSKPVRSKTTGKISHYPTIKAFLENYYLELKVDEETKMHYIRFDDDRDLYFQILNKRHEDGYIENSDLVTSIGEGYHKPVTSTGKHIKVAYQHQVQNPTAKESLLELIAQSKAKGLPKNQPTDSKLQPFQPARQLDMMAMLEHSAKAEAARKRLEAMEKQKQSNVQEQENIPLIGDFGFAGGKIVKVVSLVRIGIGSYTSEGLLVEDRKRRQEKITKDKLQPASVDILVNHINTKLVKYPEDKNKFLESIREILPAKFDAVMSKIAVAA